MVLVLSDECEKLNRILANKNTELENLKVRIRELNMYDKEKLYEDNLKLSSLLEGREIELNQFSNKNRFKGKHKNINFNERKNERI